MNKMQKIWLWVPTTFFLLPEIIWNPIGNFIYSLFMPTINGSSQIWRNSFLLDSKFYYLYIIILLIQLIGIMFFTVNLARYKNSFKSRLAFWIVFVFGFFLSLITIFVIYLAYSVHNISF